MREKQIVSLTVMGLILGLMFGYMLGREDALSEIQNWRKKRMQRTKSKAKSNPAGERNKPLTGI
jgi:hypothetical protein